MIGGNITAILQKKTSSKNDYGTLIDEWTDLTSFSGFLDFSGGDKSYKSNYKGKLEETTHIFICDYNNAVWEVRKCVCRLLIDDEIYEVLMIDNPMGLNKHLEIILKYNEVIK